jgi:hypothetical protein
LLLEIIHELERAKRISILPGAWSFNWTGSVIVSGANGIPDSIAIGSDQHFVVQYTNCTAYTTGQVVATATAPLAVQFVDNGASRNLFDEPQAIQNVCGGVAAAAGMGNLPFIWPHPWLIRAGSSAQANLTNLGTTTYTTVQITLFGIRIFALKGQLSDL